MDGEHLGPDLKPTEIAGSYSATGLCPERVLSLLGEEGGTAQSWRRGLRVSHCDTLHTNPHQQTPVVTSIKLPSAPDCPRKELFQSTLPSKKDVMEET